MDQVERDRRAYALARAFLLCLGIAGVTPQLIDKYTYLAEIEPRPDAIAGIYKRLLESAQSANMKPGVIGKAIGGFDRLGAVLYDFRPSEVLYHYASWQEVLDAVEAHLQPTGKVRREPRSIWPRYCQTILSSARFLAQFSSADEFYKWVNLFDQDDRARAALPLLLEREIDGVGFALACDFLKELGFINFAKPDVHVREIFSGIGLCSEKAGDYEVFKAVVRVAMHMEVTPYNVDKLFWLIGSGNFHADPYIGSNGRIGGHKAEFIAFARRQLEL